MRASIRCLLLGVLGIVLARHVAHLPLGPTPSRAGAPGWWGALSFAIAAVIDPDLARRR